MSQSTASRVVNALTGAIARALEGLLLTAEEVPEGCDHVLDGPPLPLREPAESPEGYVEGE